MSANNELLIEKYKNGFMVSDVDVEGCGGFFIQDEPFATLEEAIEAANEYMKNNEVEYGLDIRIK